MADAAYYHTDFTPMQSGAAISDARIRTSLTYQNWYFYADFGFGGGKFSQKNIFLQYAQEDSKGGRHAIKGGYYNDAAGSMARNTSLGSYHFISRAGAANALGEGRELGITYKYTNDHFLAYQGVFTENQYNKIEAGYNWSCILRTLSLSPNHRRESNLGYWWKRTLPACWWRCC